MQIDRPVHLLPETMSGGTSEADAANAGRFASDPSVYMATSTPRHEKSLRV